VIIEADGFDGFDDHSILLSTIFKAYQETLHYIQSIDPRPLLLRLRGAPLCFKYVTVRPSSVTVRPSSVTVQKVQAETTMQNVKMKRPQNLDN
jgi:hypothetical protein